MAGEPVEHEFEKVSWHLWREYGPVCRWCGRDEDDALHIVADVSRLVAEFDKAYQASRRLFGGREDRQDPPR